MEVNNPRADKFFAVAINDRTHKELVCFQSSLRETLTDDSGFRWNIYDYDFADLYGGRFYVLD